MRVSADVPLPQDELETLRGRPPVSGVAALRVHVRDKLHWYLAVLLFVAFLTAWQMIAALGICLPYVFVSRAMTPPDGAETGLEAHYLKSRVPIWFWSGPLKSVRILFTRSLALAKCSG